MLAPLPVHAADEPGAGFDVLRYDLALTPDIAAKTVAGREDIILRSTEEGLSRLRFSGNALSIDQAMVDGQAVVSRTEGDTLVFDLAKPLGRGRMVRLSLTYHGRPARGFEGTATTLYTSYFACDWMICAQNAFGDKADFALDLRVPAGLTTLSIGSRIGRRAGPDNSEIHRWRTPRPYSAYLFGFAVGPFAERRERVGRAHLAYLTDQPIDAAGRFADTSRMVAFLADKAGVPLPVKTYSQLLVGGSEAQEAATYSVLGLEAVPATPGDPDKDWAIVHELAHQWWGNLVTCATLRDFWLNEGITTFMTAAWKEHRYGQATYEVELAVAERRLAAARAKGFDKPLAWGGRYPNLGTRRAIQYSKGALFMAELRRTLGERAFWAGLRRYTRAHAGGVVTSVDLQRAMEAASGRDLGALFGVWVYGEG
ncbi:M1 family aminopeptidase [Sphingomonas sp. PB1R3]|uniref:M1 family aminopeptidase n=1 Tax=Sphingomonas flavida TaxID=3096154 RepID=UPI002FC7712D